MFGEEWEWRLFACFEDNLFSSIELLFYVEHKRNEIFL